MGYGFQVFQENLKLTDRSLETGSLNEAEKFLSLERSHFLITNGSAFVRNIAELTSTHFTYLIHTPTSLQAR